MSTRYILLSTKLLIVRAVVFVSEEDAVQKLPSLKLITMINIVAFVVGDGLQMLCSSHHVMVVNLAYVY